MKSSMRQGLTGSPIVKTFSVYMHIFPNGKRYIGITCQKPVEKRWYSTGGGYRKCPKMWNAIQKYGWENVEHHILYEGLPQSMAEAAEIQLIQEYDTIRNGYNADKGGNVTGSHSEETKAKISAANKGKVVSEETRAKLRAIAQDMDKRGEKNTFWGHHHTEAVKRQHSLFMRGNQYNKGHHHTDEFKEWKSKQMHEAYKDGNHPGCKRVIMLKPNGSTEIFWSMRKAAEVAGVSPATMHKYITMSKTIHGCQWRYENA